MTQILIRRQRHSHLDTEKKFHEFLKGKIWQKKKTVGIKSRLKVTIERKLIQSIRIRSDFSQQNLKICIFHENVLSRKKKN